MLQGSGDTSERAKALRETMSPPEIALWMVLRERPSGLKFRKQHPSGPFVADFYCHAARLVVEVDGGAHDCDDRPARDARRDRWFAVRGLDVMHIPAAEVSRDLDAVTQGIVARAVDRLEAQE